MSHLNFSQAKWLKKCSKKVVGYNNPIRKMVRPHCKVKQVMSHISPFFKVHISPSSGVHISPKFLESGVHISPNISRFCLQGTYLPQ